MRQTLSILLIAIVVLLALPLPAATAQSGAAPVDAVALAGGRVYLAGELGLAILSSPGEEPAFSPLPDGVSPLRLFAADGDAWLLCDANGLLALCRCSRDGTPLPVPEVLYGCAWPESGADGSPRELLDAALWGGEMYLCALDDDWECAVWRADRETGALVRVPGLDGAQRLCSRGADALLFLREDGERGCYLLSSYDGAACEELLALPAAVRETPAFLRCPRGGDEVFFLAEGNLWSAALSTGEARPLMTLPEGEWIACADDLWEGRYLLLGGPSGLLPCDPLPDADAWVLRIYDDLGSEELTRAAELFRKEQPQARVLIDRVPALTDDELLTLFLDRSAPWDVLLMDWTSPTFNALLRRGYMAPLGPAARALAARVYPLVRERLAPEGDVVCVPLANVTARASLGLSREGLARLGLREEDLPGTWEGLLRWMQGELPALLPEDMSAFMTFMPAQTWRSGLFEAILHDFEETRRLEGAAAGYDAAELRRALDLLDALDWEALGNAEVSRAASVDYSSFLFTTCADGAPGRSESVAPLLLAFHEGEAPVLALEGCALFVNPASVHLREAVAFAERACACVSPEAMCALSPERAEGLRDGDVLPLLEEAEAEVSRLETLLADAPAADRQALAEAIDAARRDVEELSAASWRVSPESLAWYRAHDACVVLGGEDVSLLLNQRELNMLRAAYLRGELPPGQFLAALEEKRSMQLREDAP